MALILQTIPEQPEFPSVHHRQLYDFDLLLLHGTVRSWLYSPVLRTAIHTNRGVEPWYPFYHPFDSENTLATDVESNYPSLRAAPGGSQSSNINPQPHLSSLAQIHDISPSTTSTISYSVDPSKYGRFHQVDLVVTDSRRSVDFLVTMSSPTSTHGKSVEHRRENKIVLEIEIRPHSIGMGLPWDCIQIPRTKSVQRPTAPGNKKALNFKLEVHGATTERIRDSLCERCTEKESRNSSVEPTLVDFTSKTSIVDLTNGKAQVAFRFLCLSTHHGLADSEYR